jgi:hypothetical protein
MDYLAFQLLWYLLVAFAFGLAVGWLACGRAKDGQT